MLVNSMCTTLLWQTRLTEPAGSPPMGLEGRLAGSHNKAAHAGAVPTLINATHQAVCLYNQHQPAVANLTWYRVTKEQGRIIHAAEQRNQITLNNTSQVVKLRHAWVHAKLKSCQVMVSKFEEGRLDTNNQCGATTLPR